MGDPGNPGDRAKAFRLRKRIGGGEQLEAIDALWLDDYNERQERARVKRSKNLGRSRSGRKMEFKLEEAAEAEGEGTAATAAATAATQALVSREEGRRLDNLTIGSVDALKEAVAVYKDICLSMRERYEVLEHTHIEMLQTIRGHYLHAVQVEGEIEKMERADQQGGDPAMHMMIQMIAKHLGLEAPPTSHRRAPPLNGGAKS